MLGNVSREPQRTWTWFCEGSDGGQPPPGRTKNQEKPCLKNTSGKITNSISSVGGATYTHTLRLLWLLWQIIVYMCRHLCKICVCVCVCVRASACMHACGIWSVGVDSPESLEREEAELIGAALILLIDSPALLKPASNNQLWCY